MEGSILMNIIQQSVELITKSYYNNLEKALTGDIDLGALVLSTEETVIEIGRNIVKEVLETLDKEIRESKARKKDWYIERIKEERTLNTLLGEISYQRTYYTHKETGEYSFLSDNQLGIRPHERMDKSLKARLVKNATTMSYQRSIDQLSRSGIRSKMIVLNAIIKTTVLVLLFIVAFRKYLEKPLQDLTNTIVKLRVEDLNERKM